MKKIILILAMLGARHAGAAGGIDVAAYLSGQGWTAIDAKPRFVSPAADIVPLMYYAKGADAPSCGLLSNAGGTPAFIEILAAEEGVAYPHCTGIHDGAAFVLAGKPYLVFAYTNRDTRDQTYAQFFYVHKDQAGRYVADQTLNEQAGGAVEGVSSSGAFAAAKAVNGIRAARAYALKQSQPTMPSAPARPPISPR